MTNLKRIIDEKGVQQRWLAEQVGVTEVSMSRYVSGERIPKAPMAIRMADVLGVDVKELYGWDDKHVVVEPEQPETHEERTETHACDYINRKDAIDAHYEYCNKHPDAGFPVWSLKILEDLPTAQPDSKGLSFTHKALDTVSRQAAIDIERNATVDTNPSHFESHQKFTQFMDDAEISSFGRWQWSNGFNTALTAVGIDLKKLPSAQPEIIRCKDCKHWDGVDTCDVIDAPVWDNDFCSMAERRSDE